MEEAGKDSKPKYFTDLFILLRVIFECPNVAKLDDLKETWEPLKAALPLFMSRTVGKSKELKKSYSLLARVLQISQAAAVAAHSPANTVVTSTTEVTATTAAAAADNKSDKRPEKKSSKESYEASKSRKEAKKRRMDAVAEGVGNVTFTEIDIGEADPIFDGEDEPKKKKKKKKKQVEEATAQADEMEEKVGSELPVQALPTIAKKKKKNKNVASVTVVEEVEKTALNGLTATAEDGMITTVDSSDKPAETEKNAKRKKKKAS